jgi:hypothetical protein
MATPVLPPGAKAPIKLDFAVKPATSKSPKSLLIYGQPKVGKTFAAAQLKPSIIIACEPGADMHECARQQVDNYTELMECVRQLRSLREKPRYVIFDTIDAIEDFARDEATLRYKRSNIGSSFNGTDVATELPNGAGYAWLRGALKDAVEAMTRCADHVVIVGHVRDKMIDDRGKEVMSKDLDLTGKCAKIVCGMVDAIGHVTRRGREKKHPTDKTVEDLWISFKTSETVNCGARHDHLKGREFILISADEMTARWSEIFID